MSTPVVTVVGGGIVGLTVGALFARAGVPTCLIEPDSPPEFPDGDFALRNYAVSPGAARVLRAAGAWAELREERLGVFRTMRVWDEGSSGAVHFGTAGDVAEPLGWIVEHDNLAAALFRAASGVGLERHSARLRELIPGSPPEVVLEDGRSFTPCLVVGADGMRSSVRAQAGIEWQGERYGQRALVCTVRTQLPHEACARQRFLAHGPLAMLPGPDPHLSAIVWSASLARALALEEMSDEAFTQELGVSMECCLGRIEHVSPRLSFPLMHGRAARLCADGVALVGDAAHVIHPLAGQGLNLGLLDAAALIECLGSRGPASWPRRAALARYARWRKSAAFEFFAMTDALQRLFALTAPPVTRVRGWGMHLTDRCALLKRWLSAQALGAGGDAPEIARIGLTDSQQFRFFSDATFS